MNVTDIVQRAKMQTRIERTAAGLGRLEQLLSVRGSAAETKALVRKKRPTRSVAGRDLEDVFRSMDPRDVPADFLLAVLLYGSVGRGSPLAVARDVLREVGGDVSQLLEGEARSDPRVDEVANLRILAARELGRRARVCVTKRVVCDSAVVVYENFGSVILGPVESLMVLYLNRRNEVLATRVLTVGDDAHTIVDPRQVMRVAVSHGASGVILMHNHPSGDKSPSMADVEVTRRMQEAGRILGIEVLDHLIVVPGGYTSLREEGLLSPGRTSWSPVT